MDLVYNYILNDLNLKYGDTVVAGISGGPDSMALLHLLVHVKKVLDNIFIVFAIWGGGCVAVAGWRGGKCGRCCGIFDISFNVAGKCRRCDEVFFQLLVVPNVFRHYVNNVWDFAAGL